MAPTPISPAAQVVNIVIDPTVRTGPLGPALLGNNGGVWLGADFLSNPQLAKRMALAGTAVLRWPGGSTADRYHFDGQVPAYIENMGWAHLYSNWTVKSAQMLAFSQQVGAASMLVVNHGVAVYGGTQTGLAQAATLAANWVEYCNQPEDGTNPNGGIDFAARRRADGFAEPFGVRYFEVGNEVFGPWEEGHVDGATYAKHFVEIARAMKQVDPTIAVGVPVTQNFTNPAAVAWMKGLLSNEEAVTLIDFFDIHEYFKYLFDAPNQ